MDITGSASSHGMVSEYAETLPDLTQAVKRLPQDTALCPRQAAA
jgi:hypothetical protein